MRFVLVLFSLMIHMSGRAGEHLRDSLRSEHRPDGLYVIHQVDEQETLFSIAKRYGGSVAAIIEHNHITNNKIDIGQTIEILISEIDKEKVAKDSGSYHVVVQGETLYSISKQYKVTIDDLKKWNQLSANKLPIGMELRVGKSSDKDLQMNKIQVSHEKTDTAGIDVEVVDVFDKYLVQTGETLSSIAAKMGVSIDSLKSWNGLTSSHLSIGQSLNFKKNKTQEDINTIKTSKGKQVRIDEDGFERIYEEGVASLIESMNTNRYLALHKTLPIGTTIEVRNLMNNQVVHAKVVGKLPNTGPNKKLMVRLSKVAYDQLGILDSRARVEVSYYKP